MTKDELKRRTRRFALEVIWLVDSLPRTRTTEIVGRQLLRSGTSVGANYRAACRARSPADFISKMGIVEEEADESIYWMELPMSRVLDTPRDRTGGSGRPQQSARNGGVRSSGDGTEFRSLRSYVPGLSPWLPGFEAHSDPVTVWPA